MSVLRALILGVIVAVLIYIALLFVPSPSDGRSSWGDLLRPSTAHARTFKQAQNDAAYYSAKDCPHHGSGQCIARDSRVLSGIGGGRWTFETRGWECWWFEFCPEGRKNGVRWFYTRTCTLNNDGSRSNCSKFTNDG